MNPIYHAAAQTLEGGWVMGMTTVAFMAFFLYWTWWTFSASRQAELEAAARMPLDDGSER